MAARGWSTRARQEVAGAHERRHAAAMRARRGSVATAAPATTAGSAGAWAASAVCHRSALSARRSARHCRHVAPRAAAAAGTCASGVAPSTRPSTTLCSSHGSILQNADSGCGVGCGGCAICLSSFRGTLELVLHRCRLEHTHTTSATTPPAIIATTMGIAVTIPACSIITTLLPFLPSNQPSLNEKTSRKQKQKKATRKTMKTRKNEKRPRCRFSENV